MGTYITEADLANAVGVAVLSSTADDDNDGVADPGVLALVINSAEALVDASLIGFYTYPASEPTDRLIRYAALEFAIGILHKRHPEYVRTRDADGGAARMEAAEAIMLKVQAAVKRLPDTAPTDPPKNVGGIVYNGGPNFIVDGPNGEVNGGEF